MKKVLSLITVSLLALNSVSAQSVTTPTLEPVECSTEKIFSDNTCQVCFTGGEATPDTKGILLPLGDVPWENALDGINQNFYQTGQTKAEIKTNIGTPAATWDEKGLTWAKDVIWKDLDGLQMFSLDAAKTINIKSIEKDTLLPLTAMKQVENPFVVIKIPISYYELKMGTFKESEKKTANYCVSYSLKKPIQNSANPPSNTNTQTQPKTNTPPSGNAQTPPNTPPKQEEPKTNIPSEEPETTETTAETEEEIPSYDAKVTLNAASENPPSATQVEAGPGDTLLIILAAILMSMILFPKVNALLSKN